MIKLDRPPSLADVEETDYQIGLTRARLARLESLLAHEMASGKSTENLRAIIDSYRGGFRSLMEHREQLARQMPTH